MTDNPETKPVVAVSFVAEENRFVATSDGATVGFIAVRQSKDTWNFAHTQVESGHEGGGVGSALVRGALRHVREAGGKVRPSCPFVVAYLKRHPEEHDIVQPKSLRLLD